TTPAAQNGSWSLEMTKATAVSSASYGYIELGTLSTSTSYTVTAYVYWPSSNTGGVSNFTMNLLSDSGSGWSANNFGTSPTVEDSWEFVTITGTTAASLGAGEPKVNLYMGTSAALNDVVYIDNIVVTQN
ncbi:MAG: hypothetical protein KJO86_03445, partial [Muriicola sp.]|nr:hypothetical protein [Muriicola sp.]